MDRGILYGRLHALRTYELEESGIPHPDNMLPNGEMMKSV